MTLRKRVEETSEIELNPDQLAKAAGMSRRRLDKVLVNAKISQKKIIKFYRGLVVSVAALYQGKGLSLQDLIQVPIFIFVIWFYWYCSSFLDNNHLSFTAY